MLEQAPVLFAFLLAIDHLTQQNALIPYSLYEAEVLSLKLVMESISLVTCHTQIYHGIQITSNSGGDTC